MALVRKQNSLFSEIFNLITLVATEAEMDFFVKFFAKILKRPVSHIVV